MMKIGGAGAGSVSPDPYQNVTDPQHYFELYQTSSYLFDCMLQPLYPKPDPDQFADDKPKCMEYEPICALFHSFEP
jgi:hypothetical protein